MSEVDRILALAEAEAMLDEAQARRNRSIRREATAAGALAIFAVGSIAWIYAGLPYPGL